MKKITWLFICTLFLSGCGGIDSSVAVQDGMKKYQSGDYKGALEEFNKAAESDPKNAGAFSGRAISKEQLGDYKGALDDYATYFTLKEDGPDKAKAYWSSGHIRLSNTLDYAGAIKDFDMSIKLNPDDASCYISRATAKMYLENLEGALEDCNHSYEMKSNKDLISCLTIRGMVKEKMGDFDGAIEDFSGIAELDPNSAFAYYGIGRALIGLEDIQACDYLVKAKEMGFADAQILLDQFCQ